MNQKDLVLVPFPFSNQKEGKIRPAIIISNNRYNNKNPDRIAVAVTSVIKTEPYSLFFTQDDLEGGHLLRPSRIRVDKIFTIEKSLIQHKVGTITDQKLTEIKNVFHALF